MRLHSWMVALGLLIAGAGSSRALINPRFTPADLVRSSAQIYQIDLQLPDNDSVTGAVTEVLFGEPPAGKRVQFEFADAKELSRDEIAGAFGANRSATSILLLSSTKDAASDEPVGALQINTLWYAVVRKGDALSLDKDNRALFSVWAGTARQLAAATRVLFADPAGVAFPVQSAISWQRDLSLGRADGANGCLVVDFGGALGAGVLLRSTNGDRFFQAGSKGAMPTDRTAKCKLTTASRLAATGDFDGDGRLDLVSWDGKGLKLAVQSADGTFSTRSLAVSVPECLSLDALDVGAATGPGMLVGTAQGPALLIPDGKGDFTARAIGTEASKNLGSGGLCVAADFTGDGRCDVLQVFERGTVLYAGEEPGRFGPGVRTPFDLPKNPKLAVCGDFDADGQLDAIVCGDDSLALLSKGGGSNLENLTYGTGELAYHGNANQPNFSGVALSDINNDGRQGAATFYPNRNPLVFFNRGYACFGMARELMLSGGEVSGVEMPPGTPGEAPKAKLKATETLQGGQLAGTICDLNDDCVQDLFAVDARGEAWVLFGGGSARALGLTLAASKSRGPVTVTVSDAKRRTGMYVVKPGAPAFVGRSQAGPATIEWKGTDGKLRTQKVIVVNPVRVELAL